MSGQPGAVVYAKELARVSAFYAELLGFAAGELATGPRRARVPRV